MTSEWCRRTDSDAHAPADEALCYRHTHTNSTDQSESTRDTINTV